jgi:hypothetical protein
MIQNNLPDNSKVWVYQSSREFTVEETQAINKLIKQFTANWTSHKLAVPADGAVLYNRFVVLMVDESEAGVGGCSIDSSVRFIKDVQDKYNTDFFDRLSVAYKVGEQVKLASKPEFEEQIAKGEVTDETIVFNNLIATKADLLSKWEIPLKESWHARVFAV